MVPIISFVVFITQMTFFIETLRRNILWHIKKAFSPGKLFADIFGLTLWYKPSGCMSAWFLTILLNNESPAVSKLTYYISVFLICKWPLPSECAAQQVYDEPGSSAHIPGLHPGTYCLCTTPGILTLQSQCSPRAAQMSCLLRATGSSASMGYI